MSALRESEAQFQAAVVEYLRLCGWKVFHDQDSRRNEPGLPDLICLRERVVWIELKAQRGRLRAEQRAWMEGLRRAGQEVYLWRPSDWDLLRFVMARKAA